MPVLLCRGKTYCHEVLIDEEDLEWAAAQGNWFVTHGAHGKRSSGYAVRSVPIGEKRWGLIWLHKEVLRRAVGEPPSASHSIGDHMNGNRLDNRRHNLRWATCQMNSRNRFGFAAQQRELF